MANIGILGDSAGAPTISTKHTFVKINGIPVNTVTEEDLVEPHILETVNPHNTLPTLSVPFQKFVKINGDIVAVSGVIASCTDTLVGTGFPSIS